MVLTVKFQPYHRAEQNQACEGDAHLLLVEAIPPRCNRAGEVVDIAAAMAIVLQL